MFWDIETRKENPVKMNDTATPRVEASSLLASFFFEIVCEEGVDFEDLEGDHPKVHSDYAAEIAKPQSACTCRALANLAA